MNVVPPEPSADLPLIAIIKDASVKSNNIQFTISVKTILPQYTHQEYTIVRSHDDFEWLHGRLVENPKFVGVLIPSCPPKPDFDVRKDSIAVYTDDDDTESPEYKKMKEELEREYLAFFKKTVASHETFMVRLAKHEELRLDYYVKEFMTSDEAIQSKAGPFTKIKGFIKSVKKGVDDGVTYAFSNVNESDEYFEVQANVISNYINGSKAVIAQADAMTKAQKQLANMTIQLSIQYKTHSLSDYTPLYKIESHLANFYDNTRKIESRISSDEDLKFTDTLKFHLGNLEACRDLLLRRVKTYIACDNSFKALNKAKSKNENIAIAEDHYQQSMKKCTEISASARHELDKEYRERVADLKKNLTNYCELEISHIKALMKETTDVLEKIQQEEYVL